MSYPTRAEGLVNMIRECHLGVPPCFSAVPGIYCSYYLDDLWDGKYMIVKLLFCGMLLPGLSIQPTEFLSCSYLAFSLCVLLMSTWWIPTAGKKQFLVMLGVLWHLFFIRWDVSVWNMNWSTNFRVLLLRVKIIL